MVIPQTSSRRNLIITIVIIAVAVISVMYFAKGWFTDKESKSSATLDSKEKQESTAFSEGLHTKNTGRVFSWQDADKHYGEYLTVEGTIVDTYNSGKACFLNFHPNYKKYFTAVIFTSAFPYFRKIQRSFTMAKRLGCLVL